MYVAVLLHTLTVNCLHLCNAALCWSWLVVNIDKSVFVPATA